MFRGPGDYQLSGKTFSVDENRIFDVSDDLKLPLYAFGAIVGSKRDRMMQDAARTD
jgi:hypothetical protein